MKTGPKLIKELQKVAWVEEVLPGLSQTMNRVVENAVKRGVIMGISDATTAASTANTPPVVKQKEGDY